MSDPESTTTGVTSTSCYKPTVQQTGKWRMVRGNAPDGVSQTDWIKAFNKTDDRLRKQNKWSTKTAEKERASGRIRHAAIVDLIARKKLSATFKDTNP